MKGEYNFRIEMRDQIELIGTEYAIQTQNWIEALKTAKSTAEDIKRTKNADLVRNTDFIVGLYRRKMGAFITALIKNEEGEFFEELDPKESEVSVYIETLQNAQNHLSVVSEPLKMTNFRLLTSCSRIGLFTWTYSKSTLRSTIFCSQGTCLSSGTADSKAYLGWTSSISSIFFTNRRRSVVCTK